MHPKYFMKRILNLIVILLCCEVASIAQPTLTAATNNPVIGDIIYFHACDTAGVTPGTAGAAVVWNYPSLVTILIDTTTYLACAATPYCDSFPGTTVVATDPYGDDYYYVTGSTAISLLGEETPSYSIHYSNPLDYGYYPCTYNSTHVDTGICTTAAAAFTYLDSLICDGYGTITLPTGTYNNVLRVHEIQYGTEDISTASYHWRSEYYLWYMAGLHAAVFYMGLDTNGTGRLHLNYVGYTNRNTTGISNINKSNQTFQVFPNPANEELNIKTDEGAFDAYTIINYSGVEVMHSAISSTQTKLDVEQLPAGFYVIKLKQ